MWKKAGFVYGIYPIQNFPAKIVLAQSSDLVKIEYLPKILGHFNSLPYLF